MLPSRLPIRMKSTVDSGLSKLPKVEPPKGRIDWSAETGWAWHKEHVWPEEKRAVGRPR